MPPPIDSATVLGPNAGTVGEGPSPETLQVPKPLRRRLRDLTPQQRDITTWPQIDPSKLSKRDAAVYSKRLTAVAAFLRGEPLLQIKVKYGVTPREVNRLVNRCFTQHPDGKIFGCRALVPGVRVVPFMRLAAIKLEKTRKGGGLAGALTQLFNKYPEIEKAVVTCFLQTDRPVNGRVPRLPHVVVFKAFISACRRAEIPPGEYPFVAKYLGKGALFEYCKRIRNAHLDSSIGTFYGAEAARTFRTGTGESLPSVVYLPMQRLLFDGTRLDGMWVVLVPHKCGGLVPCLIDRPWLLILQDEVTRAIVGWTLSNSGSYTEADVLNCIRSAIQPSDRPTWLSPSSLSGMPCWHFPKMCWATWSELRYDNLSSNITDRVRDQLVRTLGCAVNPGRVGSPETRAILERTFGTLSGKSVHLLPNTTGSSPADVRRVRPKESALRYRFEFRHLQEMMARTIADYNATPHTSLGYRTPLEQLKYFIDQDDSIIRHLAEENRAATSLLTMRVPVQVKGDIKTGRRLYVNFLQERYTSHVLASQPELRGKQIDVLVNTDDLSEVRAVLGNNDLGTLTAIGAWKGIKHGLLTRQTNNRRKHLKVQYEAEAANGADRLLRELAAEAPASTKAASRYLQVKAELDNDADSIADTREEAASVPEVVEKDEGPTEPSKKRTFLLH